jgi:hypothetical protein
VDGDAGIERWELRGVLKSRICPRRLITRGSVEWFNLFNFYRAGHLARAGGVLDQPALYFNAMIFVASAWDEANDRRKS